MVIDTGLATIIVAGFVAVSSMWQSWMLTRIHTQTNSNLSEAKAGKLAAEASQKITEILNQQLQKQLDARSTVIVAVPSPNPTS